MSANIVPGSLASIAQNSRASLAETFLNVDRVILVDVSGSMRTRDTHERDTSRFDLAQHELTALQRDFPGKLAVIDFSDFPVFQPSGTISMRGGETYMTRALEFVRPADACGIGITLISDGEPTEGERAVIAVARTFTTPIETIYIGRENGRGADFLRRLAEATGGKYAREGVGLFDTTVRNLLTA